MAYRKTNFGFTLIELLVVISIISLLTAIILINIQVSRDKAINSKKVQMADEYKKALELYNSQNDHYPSATESFFNKCLGEDNTGGSCFNGSKLPDTDINNAIVTYIAGPPANTDPVIIDGDNYNGIGYVCLTENPCSSYALYWVMKGPNGGGCAGGFEDNNVTPIGGAWAFSATNAVCVYSSNKTLYQTMYP